MSRGTIILKTVPRYDKYFSSYSNLKKFQCSPAEPYCSFEINPLDFFYSAFFEELCEFGNVEYLVLLFRYL